VFNGAVPSDSLPLAINASGQIGGYTQAFLLTPVADVPVPASLLLTLGGIGVLAGVARHRNASTTPQA
jgi:hypothetical protein